MHSPQTERQRAKKSPQMVRVSQKKEEDKHGQHQCDRRDQPCTCVSRQSPTKFNCAVSQEFKFHNEKYLTASEEFFLG